MLKMKRFDPYIGRWEFTDTEDTAVQIVTSQGAFELSENDNGSLKIRTPDGRVKIMSEYSNQVSVECDEEIEHFGSMGRHIFGG